jgi:hypothetical protein
MKTLTVNGVPYDSSTEGDMTTLYLYGSNKTVPVGTYSANSLLTLTPGWSQMPATLEWLKQYRIGLNDATKAALQKAAEIQNVS